MITIDLRKAIKILVLAALLVAAADGLRARFADPLSGVDPARWQAVTLTNDRVYFGRLRPAGRGFFELRDAHFIQRFTAGDGEERQEASQVRPVSDQVSDPEPDMLIARGDVSTLQNLRRDSEVVAAIGRVKAAAGGAESRAPVRPQPTPDPSASPPPPASP